MYNHKHNAGNRADVWKHFWLCEIVERLKSNEKGKITILDTHCGAGHFWLADAEEWERGIGRFADKAPDTLGRFGRIAMPLLAAKQYLGSWLLAASVLSEQKYVTSFRIDACDISEDVGHVFSKNAQRFGHAGRCWFTPADGYKIAENLNDRYSLIFIDPPYTPDPIKEFRYLEKLAPALKEKADVVAVWFPVFQPQSPHYLLENTGMAGHEILWANPAGGGQNMKGCGIGVIGDIDLADAIPQAEALADVLQVRAFVNCNKESM